MALDPRKQRAEREPSKEHAAPGSGSSRRTATPRRCLPVSVERARRRVSSPSPGATGATRMIRFAHGADPYAPRHGPRGGRAAGRRLLDVQALGALGPRPHHPHRRRPPPHLRRPRSNGSRPRSSRQRPGSGRPRPLDALDGLSARNQLHGFVDEVRIDGLLAQVRMRVGDQSLTAVITADAVRASSCAAETMPWRSSSRPR